METNPAVVDPTKPEEEKVEAATEEALRKAIAKVEIEDPADKRALGLVLRYPFTTGTVAWLRALIRRQGAKFVA